MIRTPFARRAGRHPGWVQGALGALVFGAMICGCTGDAPDDPAGVAIVRDSAGIRIVESRRPRIAVGDVAIDSVPAVRIGREESGPYQFGYISDVSFLEGGTIAVAEMQTGEIRVFDESGQHRTTLGRQGSGPGEFLTLALVASFGADSVVGYDARTQRLAVMPLGGESPRTLSIPVAGNFGVFGRIENGPFLLASAGSGYRPDLEPGAQWVETPIIAVDSESGSPDTIATLPDRWRIVAPDGNAPMPQPLLYAVQGVASDGFYWGTPDAFEVRKYDRTGALRQIIRRAAPVRRVEPSMVEEYVETWLDEVRRMRGAEAVAAERVRLEGEEYGAELPHFGSAFVDREDRLWVGRHDWPDFDGPVSWSVFGPDGEWIWEVECPAGVRLFDALGDRVLAVARDALGVPFVEVRRIRGVGGGA